MHDRTHCSESKQTQAPFGLPTQVVAIDPKQPKPQPLMLARYLRGQSRFALCGPSTGLAVIWTITRHSAWKSGFNSDLPFGFAFRLCQSLNITVNTQNKKFSTQLNWQKPSETLFTLQVNQQPSDTSKKEKYSRPPLIRQGHCTEKPTD